MATVPVQSRTTDDLVRSRELFDRWLDDAAPAAWEQARAHAQVQAEAVLVATHDFRRDFEQTLRRQPQVLAALRAATVNHMSRDTLAKRCGRTGAALDALERARPDRLSARQEQLLVAASGELERAHDRGLTPWRARGDSPTVAERAACVATIADRLARGECDAVLRMAQERRQQGVLRAALNAKGYREVASLDDLQGGTYAVGVTATVTDSAGKASGVQLDAVVHGEDAPPVFVELKSAGDETNTNKRRKEESNRAARLRGEYGVDARYLLVLGGHFGDQFLDHMVESGIEWVWEHDARGGLDRALPDVA